MRVLIRTFAVWLLVCLVVDAQERPGCPEGSHSLYSNRATSLDPASDHAVGVVSPDGQKTLVARRIEDNKDPDGMHMSYEVQVGGRTFTTDLLGFNGEVAWSPDSKAFAVTQTEGGGSLGSRVYVFYVEENSLRKLDVSRPIEKDFGRPVKCEIDILPNTGFISWQADSSTLLVAAEVVPVSVCSCSGTFRVYEMNLPSVTVAMTYSQTEAKKRFWNLLGCELRNADDSCVKTLEAHRHVKP
jgi:hypothetical protein